MKSLPLEIKNETRMSHTTSFDIELEDQYNHVNKRSKTHKDCQGINDAMRIRK
jgi:hypothetical protein